jgi:hypothetical protein
MRLNPAFVVLLSFFALVTQGCSSPASKDLFVWSRPHYSLSNLPISKSATCSFKKGLSVAFRKQEPNETEQMEYSASDENEADTGPAADRTVRGGTVMRCRRGSA